MDYPDHLYEICVNADECEVQTAIIASSLGAKVMNHTYLPHENKGKPYAIKYAVDKYGRGISDNFDGIVFFDDR